MNLQLDLGRPASDALPLRPAINALPDNRIGDIFRYGRDREGLIPLWFGEGDIPTPRFIIDAAYQGMLDGQVFYSNQRGLPELRSALSRYLQRTYGAAVGEDRIFAMTGGMGGIMLAAQSMIDPGDEMAVVAPVWPNIFATIKVMGGTPRPVQMTFGNQGWTLDLDRLFDACGPRTRAIFINTPNNPTGWIMPVEDMRRVLEFARERGLWIISDEVYNRLTYDAPRAPSFLDVIEPDDRVMIINTFSKNWAMTGWRLGWVVAPAFMGATYEKMVQFNTSGTPGFVQMGGVAALEQGEPFVEEIREMCRAGRDIVCDALEQLPRVRVERPSGAFYAFFAIDGLSDSFELAKRCVDEAAVGLAPGSAFGDGGEGYLRLCFASQRATLERAMERLTKVLA